MDNPNAQRSESKSLPATLVSRSPPDVTVRLRVFSKETKLP